MTIITIGEKVMAPGKASTAKAVTAYARSAVIRSAINLGFHVNQ